MNYVVIVDDRHPEDLLAKEVVKALSAACVSRGVQQVESWYMHANPFPDPYFFYALLAKAYVISQRGETIFGLLVDCVCLEDKNDKAGLEFVSWLRGIDNPTDHPLLFNRAVQNVMGDTPERLLLTEGDLCTKGLEILGTVPIALYTNTYREDLVRPATERTRLFCRSGRSIEICMEEIVDFLRANQP